MKDALAIHRLLLEREAVHEIVRLPRAIANADELPEVLGLPAKRCLAVRLFIFSAAGVGDRFLAAVIVPAGMAVSSAAVRASLGARALRPAPADLVNKLTDYAAELVAPFLLPDNVTALMDQQIVDLLHADDVVYTATGEPWTALGIRAFDLGALCGAKPVDLLPPPLTTELARPSRTRHYHRGRVSPPQTGG